MLPKMVIDIPRKVCVNVSFIFYFLRPTTLKLAMSEPEPVIVIKKRSRPNARVRSRTPEVTQEDTNEQPAPEEEGKDEKKNIPCVSYIHISHIRINCYAHSS